MYGTTKPEPVSPRQLHISCLCNTIVFLNQVHSVSTFTSFRWARVLAAASSVQLPAHFDAWILHSDDDIPGSDIKHSSGGQLLDIYYDNGGK